MPPDNDARGLLPYGTSLTRPVRYCSKTVLHNGHKKSPTQMAGDVDKPSKMRYSNHRKGATGRRFTPVTERSNRNLGECGGYFFLLVSLLASQRDYCNDNHAESKNSFPCNHAQHPLSISIGGKRSVTPEKENSGVTGRQCRQTMTHGACSHTVLP